MAGDPWTFNTTPSTIMSVTVTDGTTTVTLPTMVQTGGTFSTTSFLSGVTVTVSATGYNDVTTTVGTSSITFTEAPATPTVANLSDGTNTYEIKDSQARADIQALQTDKVDISDLANCHVVVETYHSGANWYRVYSDGWCEQGGQISNLTTTVVTISLQKHFVDTNYSISMTQCVENATGQFAYIRNAPTISSIDIKANSGTINKVYWEAKGYIA